MSESPAPADSQSDSRSPGRSLALLQLVRIPTVFTAAADIFLGFLLTHRSLQPLDQFVGLLAASICLYWTGMILNDYFDRDIDAQERAGRPIPSGRIPPRTALKLALALNVGGLGIAALVGTTSLLIAAALTAAIWLYDGALKKTLLAPLCMGSCRFFNVMLGASAVAGDLWCQQQTQVACGFGLYIVGLTWFARQEMSAGNRARLVGATIVISSGIGILFAFIGTLETEFRGESLFVLSVIGFTILRRLTRAVAVPTPEHVQTAIRMMLLSYIMLSATSVLATTGSPEYAITVAALLLPAFLLSRWIPMT